MTDQEHQDALEQERAFIIILFLCAAMVLVGYSRYHDRLERQYCTQQGGYVEQVLDEQGRPTEDWTCRMEDRD